MAALPAALGAFILGAGALIALAYGGLALSARRRPEAVEP
jgi:hypothetical protein